MKKPVFYDPSMIEGAYNALELNKKGHKYYERRETVMEVIQSFVDACYFLEIDPTLEMLKMFPHFEWNYVQKNSGHDSDPEFFELIRSSDYIWGVPFIDVEDEVNTILSAKKKGRRVPRRLFWVDRKLSREITTPQIQMVEKLGCNPIYWVTGS